MENENGRGQDVPNAVIHRQTSHYDVLGDHLYYPVNHRQTRDLLGKLLTQLDAMALPDRAHKAARTLLTQEVWRWWDTVYDNATSSAEGCLAPVVVGSSLGGGAAALSNRWGHLSEAAYLACATPAGATP